MGGFFGGGSPPPPPPPPPPAPKAEDPEVAEARRRQQIQASRSKGRATTLLTGASGDTSTATVERKSLLGA